MIGGMAWLKEVTSLKSEKTIKNKILFPFKQELEGIVYYPQVKGDPWRVHKRDFIDWMHKNFSRIEWR